MITREDIQNLAKLARIEIPDNETQGFTREVDAILNYVSQIEASSSSKGKDSDVPLLRNVFRDDVVTNEPGEYTESLLSNAPQREGNYLEVKKIL